MGFVPEPRRYKLVFTDPSLSGLEVLVKSLSVGDFMEVTGLDDTSALGTVTVRDDIPVQARLLDKFASCLVEWNLGPDDKPLPCTLASVRKQEVSVVRAMVKAWLEAISGVTPPLPDASSSGTTARAALEEMEELSRSLASLSRPS